MLLLNEVPFEREVINCLPLGVVVTDTSARVILWNSVMTEITGISPHQAEGELIFRWFPEIETQAVNARVPFQRGENLLHLQAQSRTTQRGRVWTFEPEAPTRTNEPIDFVSMVSHELRTPLTSIKGFIDTLLRSRDHLNEEQQVRFLNIVKNQADRLTRLVEDLLLLSRIQSGQLRPTGLGIALQEVLPRLLENLAQTTEDHKLIIELPDDALLVQADSDRLEQILTNLIDNACKYSPPGTTVTLRAVTDPSQPNNLRLTIQDQGIGIDAIALEHIFDRFYRLDRTEAGGTGLGLYITRSLVESLGGQITAESVLQKGTIFTVVLPLAPALATAFLP